MAVLVPGIEEQDRKPLSANDRKRLGQLKDMLRERELRGESFENYRDVIDFMLNMNCKLEQEAVKAGG